MPIHLSCRKTYSYKHTFMSQHVGSHLNVWSSSLWILYWRLSKATLPLNTKNQKQFVSHAYQINRTPLCLWQDILCLVCLWHTFFARLIYFVAQWMLTQTVYFLLLTLIFSLFHTGLCQYDQTDCNLATTLRWLSHILVVISFQRHKQCLLNPI